LKTHPGLWGMSSSSNYSPASKAQHYTCNCVDLRVAGLAQRAALRQSVMSLPSNLDATDTSPIVASF
jgi:hypothetical protein